jgi:hypothetical protein
MLIFDVHLPRRQTTYQAFYLIEGCMKKVILFTVLFLTIQLITTRMLVAQVNFKNEKTQVWLLQPHFAVQVPLGSMADRFYTNSAIGFGAMYKTKSNWFFGADLSYLFAEKVKNEDQILSNITTSEGFVIDQTGVFANIHFRQRGFYANIKSGYVIPTKYGNPNSGILLMGTLGLLQHKIRIEVHENTAPQLDDQYKKGYDKLSNGPGASFYLGYLHLSNNQLANFSVGLEYLYAVTASRRDYDFVLMKKDDAIRHDQLLSIRFNWIIPVYARAPKEFYYN